LIALIYILAHDFARVQPFSLPPNVALRIRMRTASPGASALCDAAYGPQPQRRAARERLADGCFPASIRPRA
jgi:hypothetical protein